MLRRYVLCAGLLFQFSVSATDSTFNAPLVEKSLLLDAASSSYQVVVGERGHVIVAENDGEFVQKQLPLAATLTAVETVGDNIWVAGHDATIMHSADRGTTWQVQMHEPELERPFLDILFFDDQHGVASGAYGLFYRTRDGGATWESEQHASLLNPIDIEYLEEIKLEDEAFYLEELNSILPHINRLRFADGQLFAAGETGLLALSNDNGQNWQRFEIDYFGSFFDIETIGDDQLLAAGLRGTLYSKVGENDWQRIDSCTTATLNSIVTDVDGSLLVLGNNGAIVELDKNALANNTLSCSEGTVSFTQLTSKSAIATAIQQGDGLVAITSDGLQPLVQE